MAVSLRLMRLGKKHKAFYRIVALDKRKNRNARYIDNVGFYDPFTEPATLELKNDRFDYWVSKGAVLSEGLRKLLKNKPATKKD